MFSIEVNDCRCSCNITYGDRCNFGPNVTTADVDNAAIPTRKANITLDIKIPFLDAYYDLLSPESLSVTNKLQKELKTLCKSAEPLAFKEVKVDNLQPGSVIEAKRVERSLDGEPKIHLFNMLFMKLRALKQAKNRSVLATSRAQYVYDNNATQINWLNTRLDEKLTQILEDNIQQISQAFANASVLLKEVVSPTPQINDITDILPFVNCSAFANYTAEVIDGQWQCVGPCKTTPGYCSGHGECLNDILAGAMCRCYESNIRQYYGQRCDLSRWGRGFYGAIFGSLAAALLLVMIVLLVVFLVKKGRSGMWKKNDLRGFLDFEEDYFDFTDTGRHDLGLTGPYTAERFRRHLEDIDTQMQVSTKRPEVLNVSSR
ncbi:uncharacterized protein LOC144056548 [Vanacampus margaritifer]